MEIKITKQTTEEEVLQIELPYYSKSYAHYYKVISEKQILQLHDGINSFDIVYRDYAIELAFKEGATQCTEDEFNTAYFNIQSKLNQQL